MTNILRCFKLRKIKIKLIFSGVIFIFGLIGCSSGKPALDPDFREIISRKESTAYIDTNTIKKEAVDHVITGSQYEQQQRYADAILEFQDALEIDSSASIYFAIAKNYKNLYKLDKAETFAIKAIRRDSTFIDAFQLLGEIYILRYKANDAVRIYEQIVKLKPSTSNYLTLGRLYELTNVKKAIELYESLLTNTEDVSVLRKLANLFEDTHDTLRLIGVLEKIYDYEKDDVQSVLALTQAYLGVKEYSKAFSLIDRIDSRLPATELNSFYGFIGGIIIDDTSKGIEPYLPRFYKKIDGRFYFNWRIQFIAGMMADRVKDSLETEKFYKKALIAGDSIIGIPLQVASFYLQKSRFHDAVNVLSQYEEYYPNDYRFPYFQGIAYTGMDNNDLAIDRLNQALLIDSLQPEVYVQLGLAYDRLKRTDLSDLAYKSALKLDSTNPLANNNYAYTLSERGQELDKALKMVRIALAAEPDNASYLDTYAWVMYKLGNYPEALKFINHAIATGDVNADVYGHLGEIYLKMGDTLSALKAWKKGLEREPQNKMLLERIKTIE
jgi:tetratricopeptide (TPR) repeat protein